LRAPGHHPSARLQESLRELRDRLPPRRLLRLIPPPAPPLRPGATFAVLDVTKYYGDTTGGVRTYLNEKSAYIAARPSLRHVLVVPGAVDGVEDGPGTRTYRLAMVAQPDAKWGETPCAFVELKEGASATQEELIEFCRARMARFKAPKSVVFGPLPKTSTGKIQKFLLRERAKSTAAIE
jgi:hypothetical protein